MSSSILHLRPPSLELVNSYLEMIAEFRQHGEKVWDGIVPLIGEGASPFVDRLRREETHPAPGLVAQTTYWAVLDERVVGRIGFRHELNANLEEFGGHIGYEVRPSARRAGIAKEMLKQLLTLPLAQKVGRMLLTCSPVNEASNRTILANGGVLSATKFVEKIQRDTNYYWISLRG